MPVAVPGGGYRLCGQPQCRFEGRDVREYDRLLTFPSDQNRQCR